MSLLIVLLNLLLLAGLVLYLRKQRWAKELKPFFYPALLLKLVSGVLLGVLYFYHYGEGDTITYYQASQHLTSYAIAKPMAYLRLLLFNEFESQAFQESLRFSRIPGFSNSFFMLKIVSTLNLLTNSSYYINSLYLSVFSFWGTAKLAGMAGTVFPTHRGAAVVAFLFFPSVAFWGSGLLKDSVMLGSMCWVAAFALQVVHKRRVKLLELLLLLIMLYLYVRIKIFLSAPFVALLLGYVVLSLLQDKVEALRRLKVQLLVLLAGVVVAGTVATQLIGFYKPAFVFQQIFITYEGLLSQSQHVMHLEYPHLEPTWSSIIFYAPQAAFHAVFRPFVGESAHPLYILMGLENLVLFLLFLLAAISFSKRGMNQVSLWQVVLLVYILVTAAIIGLTTPNFGSLSRYRIAFLPFLVYLLLQSHYAQQLLQRLRFRLK